MSFDPSFPDITKLRFRARNRLLFRDCQVSSGGGDIGLQFSCDIDYVHRNGENVYDADLPLHNDFAV